MTDKVEIRLVRDVSASVQRVMASLASAPMHAAHQMDPATKSVEGFRDVAWGHAEMLEREARNIRDAVAKFQESN